MKEWKSSDPAKRRFDWLRSERGHSILQVRATLLKATRSWFHEKGYVEVHGPTLLSGGDSSFFEVQYYEQTAYLTHGLQPYALALLPSFNKIYTIAPSFRVEPRATKRHLTEYWRVEAEAIDCDLDGIMKTQEELLTYIAHSLINEVAEELRTIERDLHVFSLIKCPFPKITYDDAVTILQNDGVQIYWGEDLSPEQETRLTRHYNQPFFVTHYPMSIARQFVKSHPTKPELTLSADLFAPGHGEIASVAEMIDLRELLSRMKAEKMNPRDIWFYIDLERFGSYPPCSGFALGVERTVKWVCNLKNIRDTTAFPRSMGVLYP